MQFVVGKVYHIRGFPVMGDSDVSDAQGLNGNKLSFELGAKFEAPDPPSVEELRDLLVNAAEGTIFLYDGHGSVDGSIFMRDNEELTGTELRDLMKKSKARFYLLCCYSALVAAHGQQETQLRGILSCILANDPSSGANVSAEVDSYVARIKNGSIAYDQDPTAFVLRVADAVQSVGVDRFPQVFHDRIVPLSIGSALVMNDAIVISLFKYN